MQRTNKALDTGLALLTRHRVTSRGVLRSLGRRVSKTGLCTPRNQLRRVRERERERERKTDRHRDPSSYGAKVL